ncbi:MAG: MotA/TolQ/ExbB proton channel family protein [Deltaproteobacteria bacterium]|nr:MotA/TolQ/ExbB proton channel family protein [Deltaproteobacteria bacterium]
MVTVVLIASSLLSGLVFGRDALPGFIDFPSILITFGGTFAVTLVSFSWCQIRELGIVLLGLFTEERRAWREEIEDFKRLAHLYLVSGPRGLENQEKSINDPFVRRGIGMIVDLRREEEIREQLRREALLISNRQESARQVLLAVGKLLPAFGLIGTLIGLVVILRQIPHQGPDGLTSALSVAVLTTLYGAFSANVIIYPLVSKLQSASSEQELRMRLAMEGVACLARGEGPATVEQKLYALLPAVQFKQRVFDGWSRLLPAAHK